MTPARGPWEISPGSVAKITPCHRCRLSLGLPVERRARPRESALSYPLPPAKAVRVPHPDPTPSSLDDLLARAEHYANYCMNGTGRVTPVLFLIGADGLVMFAPESLADAPAKDDFATSARLMCIAHAATACVMVLEAWVKFATPGEKLDLTEAPSEAFDRREFVVLMGESRDGQKQRFLPIIRRGNGKFFGFGEPEVPEIDEMKGRFAQILSPKIPDAATRDLAKAMLRVKGAMPATARSAPRLPRSRR